MVIGTTGQCVSDLLAYSAFETPLDALLATVRGRCLAPTAPDTLCTYPEAELTTTTSTGEAPHIVFSSNHGTRCTWTLEEGVLCLTVPSFWRSGCAVAVDISDPRNVVPIELGTCVA